MRLVFARHGLSNGNLDEMNYIANGDAPTALADPQGWQQAIAMGKFLRAYYKSTRTRVWPYVFVSGFRRTKETLAGALHGIGNLFRGRPSITEDTRLSEEFFGATSRLKRPDTHELDWRIAGQIMRMQRNLYETDRFMTPHFLGESRKDINTAVRGFLDGPMARMAAQWFGKKDVLIISHGFVIQELIRALMNLPMDAEMKNAGNCDVFEAIGDFESGWRVRRIYDGQAMKAVDEPLEKLYTPTSFATLPHVPEALR
ncbi:MAG TPA: phosphoglycerate mutase family protein [Alphaproteobacteria bacterium]|nr:phosphoglycerate mutase family protein [Alphaproteobacteria bacterium]